jgi:hypothetical protein
LKNFHDSIELFRLVQREGASARGLAFINIKAVPAASPPSIPNFQPPKVHIGL